MISHKRVTGILSKRRYLEIYDTNNPENYCRVRKIEPGRYYVLDNFDAATFGQAIDWAIDYVMETRANQAKPN